ncbi:MCE family protein [Mycobacterium sp. 236(2023)]|uniref:MCE family protein n=1 Tax=Mycobacterium sp. 236(2023) TaxID=3038163 RepID=UPI0024151048|nr:MCE family protein [Mycobacterium sp. 236(2023)]MDG4667923.1 MCE family protein [Mycobacterium sp. 236(2023)]
MNVRRAALSFLAFATVMVALTAFLFMVFDNGYYGSSARYSAVFANSSQLKEGDTVRAAGLRVGTVQSVRLQQSGEVIVDFDADPAVTLTTGSKVAVHYLNLVGDRFLELVDSPGSTRILPRGSQIPVERTVPALDLDLLIGGLKPVLQGLNPQDVNALTASLLQVFQGQDQNLESLFARTSAFTNRIAADGANLKAMLDNLNTVVNTLAENGDQFGMTIERLEQLAAGYAQDRDPIGESITALSNGTASIADLLSATRSPLAATVDELNRLAPSLDGEKDVLDDALKKAPENYRKLARLGSYGSWINFYICGLSVRVTDLQGRTALFPWIRQDGGRCVDS